MDIHVEATRLTIRRSFSASPERVFRAWTDPEQLAQWFGCNMTESVKGTVDLRPGGACALDMQGGYGDMHFAATYDEVVPNERLVYTTAIRFPGSDDALVTKVTLEFEAQGSGTLLKLTQEGFPANGVSDNVAGGTTQSLDKLERYLSLQTAA